MGCKRCPHHVRHGFLNASGKIEFSNLCGLKVKKIERDELEKNGKKPAVDKRAGAQKAPPKVFTESEQCEQYPFSDKFEYMGCPVYLETFKTARHKNDVIPTKDFQYSEAFAGSAITDMELL